jgi:hypothetical protein
MTRWSGLRKLVCEEALATLGSSLEATALFLTNLVLVLF